MSDSLVYFNGVRPDGSYLQPPLSTEELRVRLLSEPPDWQVPTVPDPRDIDDPRRIPVPWVRTDHLEEAGWAVVFPAGLDRRIKRALRPLLDRREEQAGREVEERYQEVIYYPGESVERFRKRNNLSNGPVDPDKFPYYVLLVGDPQQIPFELQFDLDQQFGVGRLCLDEPEHYANYARGVVASEKRRLHRQRKLAFFAALNDRDRATERLNGELVEPLLGQLTLKAAKLPGDPWYLSAIQRSAASKERLLNLLGGPETPDMLFTACHGLLFEPEDERQLSEQGGLVTSDWPGEGNFVLPEHCVTAADISVEAELQGLIAFHFACFSAGTQARDSFLDDERKYRQQCERDFCSKLPQRLLGHPNGGALAVIGHVDRAWTTSFAWNDIGELEAFESALFLLCKGQPVGFAMEYFGQLYGDHATKLEGYWDERLSLDPKQQDNLGRRRLATRDARNFVVLGDPAVRIGPVPG